MTDPTTDPREPDNPAAWALAQHIADHPMSTIQAAFRYLNAPLEVELSEASAVSLPPADQTALRDRIRRVLCERDGQGALWGTDMLEPDEYGEDADAVLAVLPATTDQTADRAAVLRDAAEALGRMDYDSDSNDYGYDTYRDAWNGGVMDGAAELRRMADETQPAASDRAAFLESLLRCLASPVPCDWEGDFCRSHEWRSDAGRCPHGQAQALLDGVLSPPPSV
ncbi:hypothetical protein ABZ387_06945 [Streptomyces flaveolus]|uniref:hypothetical protein n=1 Tax=Streptomyces flaveolus TaxID=67297 RepID=UPI0034113279